MTGTLEDSQADSAPEVSEVVSVQAVSGVSEEETSEEAEQAGTGNAMPKSLQKGHSLPLSEICHDIAAVKGRRIE